MGMLVKGKAKERRSSLVDGHARGDDPLSRNSEMRGQAVPTRLPMPSVHDSLLRFAKDTTVRGGLHHLIRLAIL